MITVSMFSLVQGPEQLMDLSHLTFLKADRRPFLLEFQDALQLDWFLPFYLLK